MKTTTYIVKLKMQDTQDSVRDYTKNVECNTYYEAKELIQSLKQNSSAAFKKYSIYSHYDYIGVIEKIFRTTVTVKELEA